MDPPEWICPPLAIEVDAFNHGGTPEFAAISAVAVRHNAIVETLTSAAKTFEPIFARKPNRDIDDSVPLRRRPGAPDAWTAQERAGNRTVPANTLQGYSGRRRKDASVLDADTLQDPIIATGRTWKLIPLTVDRMAMMRPLAVC